MRIKQLHVTRYGPMAPFHEDALGRFVVFHGPNERGKTLLVDALVRLLFKRELRKSDRKHFGNMGRVAENPEGFVVLESRGAERKLESNESLNDVTPVRVTPEDFRNTFVVRDSDLSLRDEDAYYGQVTEKLTGLRASEIEALMRAIQQRGRLRSVSPESDLANNVEQGKIADRMRDTAALIDEARSLRESLQDERYDELELELVRGRERLKDLELQTAAYQAAELTKRFRRARDTLGELKRNRETIEGLSRYDPEELKRWQKFALKRERLESDIAEDRGESEGAERAIRSARKTLAEQEARAGEVEGRVGRVNGELKPLIDDYQDERAEFRRAEPQGGSYRKGLVAAFVMAVLALVGYSIRPSLVLVIVAAATALVWLALGFQQLRLRRAQGRVRARMDRLHTESRRLGIAVASVDEVMSAVGDLEREAEAARREVQSSRMDIDNLVKEKSRVDNRIQLKKDQISEIDADVLSLQTATYTDSVTEYQSALERRSRLSMEAEMNLRELRDLLPTTLEDEAAVADWERRIDAHLDAAEKSRIAEFDADAQRRMTVEKEGLQSRVRNLEAALLQGSRKLHSIEVKARELDVLEAALPCRTTQELDHVARAIGDFRSGIERDQRTAQETIRICQEIEADEKARVSDLFGRDSLVSSLMFAITSGRYTAVEYDSRRNAIYVVSPDGARLPAEHLSGGALDQLHLAIRVTIAGKLLGEEKGFLILDDPFVRADAERLRAMMDALRHLVEEGWQILYFTAKDEVTEALREDVRARRVQLLHLDGCVQAGLHAGPEAGGEAGSEAGPEAGPEAGLFD